MELVHQIDLDWVAEGTTVEEVEAEVTESLDELGLTEQPITATVIVLNGPGGGNPIIRFRTPHWGTMIKLLHSYADSDLEEAINLYDERVLITL